MENFRILINGFFEKFIFQTFDINKHFFMKVIYDVNYRVTFVLEIYCFMNFNFFVVGYYNQWF